MKSEVPRTGLTQNHNPDMAAVNVRVMKTLTAMNSFHSWGITTSFCAQRIPKAEEKVKGQGTAWVPRVQWVCLSQGNPSFPTTLLTSTSANPVGWGVGRWELGQASPGKDGHLEWVNRGAPAPSACEVPPQLS